MTDLTVDDIVDIEAMRQRLGLKENDTIRDIKIVKMTPFERVKLLAGWYDGNSERAIIWKERFESQGLFLTTNPDADGVI